LRKKTTRLTGLSKRLLTFLNKQKGFFEHGNKIRFSVHLGHRESALLFCLANSNSKASDIIGQKLEKNLSGLSESLEWDGTGRFWFDETNLLLNLASENRFYFPSEILDIDLQTYHSHLYPFGIVKGPTKPIPDRSIPVTYHGDTITIGEGEDYLFAHNYIDSDVIKLLQLFPTKVKF
jgi:hypothetical protein